MNDITVTIKIGARRLARMLTLEEQEASRRQEERRIHRAVLLLILKLPDSATDGDILKAIGRGASA
jgi:hypothetical protein